MDLADHRTRDALLGAYESGVNQAGRGRGQDDRADALNLATEVQNGPDDATTRLDREICEYTPVLVSTAIVSDQLKYFQVGQSFGCSNKFSGRPEFLIS